MKQVAIAIMADPNQGEEALGRVLNALIMANDLQSRSAKVKIFFQGTGPRWVNLLEKQDHPGHGLYKSLTQCTIGASSACSEVFKANITTIPLLKEYEVAGVGSVSSLANVLTEGYDLIVF